MPTGYTEDIERGITLKEFILKCAIMFVGGRDGDTTLRDPKPVDPYHKDEMAKALVNLQKIKKMSYATCERKAYKAWEKSIAYASQTIDKRLELREKYHTFRKQVEQWVPPTSNHNTLKKFMLEQIDNSILWDTSTDYYKDVLNELRCPQSGYEWKEMMVKMYEKDYAYHCSQYLEEQKNTICTNLWVTQLKHQLDKAK